MDAAACPRFSSRRVRSTSWATVPGFCGVPYPLSESQIHPFEPAWRRTTWRVQHGLMQRGAARKGGYAPISAWQHRSLRSCERIGWQAKPPAPPTAKWFGCKVGQAVLPAFHGVRPILSQLLTVAPLKGPRGGSLPRFEIQVHRFGRLRRYTFTPLVRPGQPAWIVHQLETALATVLLPSGTSSTTSRRSQSVAPVTGLAGMLSKARVTGGRPSTRIQKPVSAAWRVTERMQALWQGQPPGL